MSSGWNMLFDPKRPGWIPPEERTADMQRSHERFLDDTPHVSEVFHGGYNADRPRIWQLVKQAYEKGLIPDEYMRNGTLKNLNQLTGSCVGFGAGNALLWASVVDAIHRRQQERIVVPFVLYHYGRGRLHSGIRGRGEGSTGSGQAKALQQDGYLAFDSANCPQPQFADVVKWSSGLEMEWSDGARIGEQYLTEGRQHLTPNVVRVTSLDEAQMLLDSYYVFTIASSWGGMMRCPVQDGVLLNRRTGTWMHQMFVLDYITHPRLGRLWWVGNNWGYVHGTDPGGEWDGNTGAPEGGFYIADSDMSYIIRQNETFAFADPQGFVDRSRLSWRMF